MKQLLLAVLCCVSAAPVIAGTITTNDGNGADSYGRSGSHSGTNYGNLPFLVIKGENATNFKRKSYIRFDLSGVTVSLGSATLELTTLNAGVSSPSLEPAESVYNVFGLNDGHSGENWGEHTLAWNNAPENSESSTGLGPQASLLGQLTIPSTSQLGDILLVHEPISAQLSKFRYERFSNCDTYCPSTVSK